MSKLKWDQSGDRLYETGVSKGVLFVKDTSESPATPWLPGVVWNGLTNVTVSPTGAEPNAIYADNIKYLNLMSIEELEASIEAYTYPDEFGECDGSVQIKKGGTATGVSLGQQSRKEFAFAWQTKIGNDLNPDAGYKIHIVYGALASPSERAYDTVNDSPEAITFSWDVTTTPLDVDGHKPTAYIVIDSTKADTNDLAAFEAILYGKDATESPEAPAVPAKLLTPAEVIAHFTNEG